MVQGVGLLVLLLLVPLLLVQLLAVPGEELLAVELFCIAFVF